MIVKKHPTPNGLMIAVCDSDILGKKFEEGERQLDLSGQFYRGKEHTPSELKELMRGAYVINAVGEESVSFLVKEGLVEKEKVMKVSGIPYAQCVVER